MVSIMIVGVTLFSQASPAKAYWAWGRTWSNHFDEANRVADFESVTLHEFGHAHGLGHPWQDCPARPNCPMTAAETASVMNVTFTLKRTLTSDDSAGLAAIY